MKRRRTLFVLGAVAVCVGFKPYYQSMQDMIRSAAVIAVVEVKATEDLPPSGDHPFYRQRVVCRIATSIKGNRTGDLAFFIPKSLPQVEERWEARVVPGKSFLVFLDTSDERLEIGNYFLACRPVTDGKLEWYSDYLTAPTTEGGGNPFVPPDTIALATQSLDAVVLQIRDTLKKKEAPNQAPEDTAHKLADPQR